MTLCRRAAASRTHFSKSWRTASTVSPKSPASSPRCGVSTGICLHRASSLRCPWKANSASASSTKGFSRYAANLRTTSPVASNLPRPGPMSTASFPSESSRSLASASSPPMTPGTHSGTGTVMTSVVFISMRSAMLSGTASVTMPAPIRSAASDARYAAPVMPREPATTSTCPQLPLCTSSGRNGTSVVASASSSNTCRIDFSSRSWSGKPISSTSSFPVSAAPGQRKCPTFGKPNVSVTAACIATVDTAPVSAATPEGMSMDTTGFPMLLTSSMSLSTGLRSSPANPVPSTPSTTTSAKRSENVKRSQVRSLASS